MKRIIAIFTILFLVTITTMPVMASTGPGDPGSDPELGGDPPLGGGAPIGGGTLILIGLGAAYGGKKLYDKRKESLEE